VGEGCWQSVNVTLNHLANVRERIYAYSNCVLIATVPSHPSIVRHQSRLYAFAFYHFFINVYCFYYYYLLSYYGRLLYEIKPD